MTAETQRDGSFEPYTSIMIGDNPNGESAPLPVELRDGGILDFGKDDAVMWYSEFGYGLQGGKYFGVYQEHDDNAVLWPDGSCKGFHVCWNCPDCEVEIDD